MVTEHVIFKGQTNNSLPNYTQLGDIICLNCYNGIIIGSVTFQKHALNQSHYHETETSTETFTETFDTNLTFSQAKELPPIWIFEEFRAIMELEDEWLKSFFNELYSSTNPLRKSKNTMEKVSKQLVFLCYFICGIRNKFVNNAKRDLGMYLDSTGTPNSTIDTLATLGMSVTSRSIAYHKDAISKKHMTTVESNLADSTNNVLVLNIDDYHSIHSKRMPNTTTTSTAEHFATILLSPIKNQPAIPRLDIHNLAFRFVDDETKLEELTVHSYDVRLKEKRSTRSLKDAVLVNLLENNLHSIEAYIKAINVATSVPVINRYIEDGNVIPVIADWSVYQYSSRNIETLKRKTACFLLDCFSDIYTCIKRKNIPFLIPPQVAMKKPSKKRMEEESASIPIPAMKIKEAWLCHLPLGYSSSHKPSLSGCDSSNCFITNNILIEETGRVLPCGHAYHDTCFSQDGSKCLHCLDYINNGVDNHVNSLLESLCQLNSNTKVKSKDRDSIPEDNDNTKESADNISAPWDNTIWRFLLL
ncbi:16100_t:CDS:2 [Acaulospora morrowiae]|uniref:16100_t:CDS:1 n=1 Tax=Acaulospora morrowiae TaxID=94023 RepID=A0A9N9G9E1_9GLOM|nr:16100_t:CDS:2 [Acaulospora morrowiae]